MTKNEVRTFMLKIKSYFQTFSMEDYVINEWMQKLKDYDVSDLYDKLDFHLKGEYKDNPPKLHFLTMHLKTVNQKAKQFKMYVECKHCGTEFDYSTQEQEFEHCQEICGRKKYLEQEAQKYGFKIKTDLDEISEYELDLIYTKVIKHIKGLLEKIDVKTTYEQQQLNAINNVLKGVNQ